MSEGNILYKLDPDEQEFDRELDVDVTDYVYINSAGKVEKADASTINKMPAIGRVVKVFGGKCVVKKDFIETEYSAITPRTAFFISPTDPGEITDVVPSDKDFVMQPVGFGLNSDKILVRIDPTNIVIRG